MQEPKCDHNNVDLRPVDIRARDVVLSHDRKFNKLDSLIATDGGGDVTGNVAGSFEVAKARFFWGQVKFLFYYSSSLTI